MDAPSPNDRSPESRAPESRVPESGVPESPAETRMRTSSFAAARVIFRKEILDILRDRRAVFFGVVLPVLLYPVLYLALSSAAPSVETAKVLRIGVWAGSGGPAAWDPLRDCLRSRGLEVEDAPFDPDEIREGALALHLAVEGGGGESGDGSAATGSTVAGVADGGQAAPPRIFLRYRSASPDSVEALRRAADCADEHRDRLLDERFRERRLLPTTRFLDVDATDLSTPGERERWRYAKLLPVLLVILLLSGGSFIALDLVAGEKERGTLETLYVHPVPTDAIVWGKFLALLAGSLVCGLVNILGLFGSLWIGAAAGIAPRGLEGAAPPIPDPLTLGIVVLAVIPLVVMTSAALLIVSTVARSFREAQNYLMPLTLATVAILLLAVAPGARLASIVCVVPFAGTALAIREALEGTAPAIPYLLACVSALAYGGLLLRKAAELLRREDVVLDLEPPYSPRDAEAEGRARRALAFSAFMLLFLYYAATWLQTAELRADRPLRGVAITLWGLVLLPALIYPLLARVPYRETLGLRRAPLASLLLTPVLAAAAVVLVSAYMAVQSQFLHAPRALDDLFRDLIGKSDLGLGAALAIFALSPAICEELLWRGAVQGELEPRGRPLRTAVSVGVLFGLFHMSVHRFVPTALLGALLATVRHRSGSIFPCMVLHAAYNGTLVLLSRNEVSGSLPPLDTIVLHPLTIASAAVLLPLCVLGIRGPRSGGSGKGRAPAAGERGDGGE